MEFSFGPPCSFLIPFVLSCFHANTNGVQFWLLGGAVEDNRSRNSGIRTTVNGYSEDQCNNVLDGDKDNMFETKWVK
jgi:hypothetical protein